MDQNRYWQVDWFFLYTRLSWWGFLWTETYLVIFQALLIIACDAGSWTDGQGHSTPSLTPLHLPTPLHTHTHTITTAASHMRVFSRFQQECDSWRANWWTNGRTIGWTKPHRVASPRLKKVIVVILINKQSRSRLDALGERKDEHAYATWVSGSMLF